MNESTTTQEAAVMGFLEEYIFQKPLDPSRVGGSSLRFLPCGCLVLIDDGYVAQYILVTYEGRRCEDFDIHEIIAQYEFLRGRQTDVKGMRDALEQWAKDLGTEKAQEMLAAFDAAVYARTPKAGEEMTVKELERLYAANNPNGHYFDPETLAIWGSQRRRVQRVGEFFIYSEYQAAAPFGVDRWRAVLFDLSGHLVGDSVTGATREAAVKAVCENRPRV